MTLSNNNYCILKWFNETNQNNQPTNPNLSLETGGSITSHLSEHNFWGLRCAHGRVSLEVVIIERKLEMSTVVLLLSFFELFF